jgi:hypothetical protein
MDSRQQAEERGQTTDDRRQKKRESPVGAAFPDLSLSKVSRDLAI